MPDQSHTHPNTAKWLWLILFTIAWPPVAYVCAMLGIVAGLQIGPAFSALIAIGLATFVAWIASRVAFAFGATTAIWKSVALGSCVPLIAGLAIAVLTAQELSGIDLALLLSGFLLFSGLPPAAVYIESRRHARRIAASGGDPTSLRRSADLRDEAQEASGT